MRRLFLCVILIGWCSLLRAQYEGMEYYQEEDPAVKAKLEQWQDLKFGFFVHHWKEITPVSGSMESIIASDST